MKNILSAFLFSMFLCTTLSGQTSLSEVQLNKINDLCQEQFSERNYPGMAIVVAKGDQILFEKGYGYQDIESKTPISTSISLFRIGSVSKSYTAAAMAVLYDKDKLDLDAEVQKYVLYFPKKEYPISVKQVAGHIAGVRHYKGMEFAMNEEFPDVKSGLKIFQDDPLLFQPGSAYKYSTYGWNLLSAVVEGASGSGFIDFIEREVFTPLKMSDSYAEMESFTHPDMVSFYRQNKDGKIIPGLKVNNSYKWAGGGFLSTAHDLLNFSHGVQSNKLFSAPTRDLFWTSQKLSDGSPTNYGMGWINNRDKEGRMFTGHSGGSEGGTTMLLIYPEEEITVITLVNMSSARMNNLAGKIAAVVLNGI